ncbi:MAG: type II secretion system protein GspD, partial [Pseudomonadota bacterium]
LNALEEQTNSNILSTPSILTLDNQEAFITVGQQVPFVTGSFTNTGSGNDGATNPFQTIERENVGITLTVTPQINDGDAVVLDITQEVSSISGATAIASDVITNERKVETMVVAEDNRVVVLGGLIQDNVQEGRQKVPLLGDIPFLGRLFRTDSESLTKTNLLIFIRPTIIRDSKALAGATAEKYRYIREQQLRQREAGLLFLEDDYVPLVPQWQEQLEQLEQIKAESETASSESSDG